jgi:VCBS repeat-containing protein
VAPVPNGGPDQTITLPNNVASLSGTATDDGLPGTGVTTQWSKVSGPGTVTFGSATALATTATFSSTGSYVLQLSASDGLLSATDTIVVTVAASPTNKAIDFAGTNAYVTFGPAAALGVQKFTIETWFRRDGTGIATNTGTGGVVAVPLVTKGMAETESAAVDMNYFLGIRGTDGVLVGDFEDTATSANHPVVGATAIAADGAWHHAAATYDGTTWRLYLDGALDAQLVVGAFTPQFNSTQHAALGTALNSTGGFGSQTQGAFDGVLDEARVWNYARSAAQISRGMTLEIPSAPGLRGRWGMGDGSGTTVADSSGTGVTGTIVNSAFAWVAGAPFTGQVNRAPVATADAAATAEGTAVVVAVLSNDSDLDGDVLTVTSAGTAAHGTTAVNANGTITYTPAAGYSGPDAFTYAISDNQGGVATGNVSLTVTSVNEAPTAVNDAYSTNKNTSLNVPAPGVLGNDVDGDGDGMVAAIVTGPAHGALTLGADGGFVYTPAANYTGPDAFTYVADDGVLESNTATVTLTVVATNAAPVAVNDSYSTNEDTPLTIAAPGLVGNDSDPDGDALNATLVAGASHGTVVIGAGGAFTYTPAANYNGPDSFTYRAGDGVTTSNVATVGLTVNAVNDAPAAAADSYSTPEDTALTIAAAGVLGNDTDVDGNPLTAAVTGPAHGVLTLNADGSFTYTPAADYNGADAFTYKAGDGLAQSAAATVSITITAVNDAPGDRRQRLDGRRHALTVAAPGVLGNDTDVDAQPLTAVLVTGPSHGTLILNANGSYSYQPAANYNGPDSFTYRASDGTATSAAVTVSLTVTAVNDTPFANDDAFTGNEDASLQVAAPGVLANDTDEDAGSLTASVRTDPAHGALTLNANGSFTYVPVANYTGPDSFTYTITDNGGLTDWATVAITVAPAPDPPSASDDSYAITEDTTLVLFGPAVLANDTDVDGLPLTAILVTGPSHGTLTLTPSGGFTYSPAANYSGPDTFTYKASNGARESNVATVSLTVNGVNDAPAAVGNSYATNEDVQLVVNVPGVLGNDTDADGNPLTAALVTGPAHGTLVLDADGGFRYTPAPNYNGPDSFTYQASDGTLTSGVVTVSLSVTSVNDTPVAGGDSYTATEDTPLTIAAPGLLVNDSDIEGSSLTAAKLTNPAHGTVTVNTNGSFTYTPAANYNGPDSFTYRVSDGSLNSAAATVSITVNAVNDPPVAWSQSKSTNEDTSKAITLAGTDVEGSTLAFTIVTPPAHGVLTGVAPAVTYVPAANYNGPDSFTFRVNDGALDSTTVGTVSLTVTPVNDAPVAVAGSFTTPVVTPYSGTLVASDIDGNPLTYSITTSPTKGTLSVNANTGAFTYTPLAGRTGADSFRFRVNDGTTNSGIVTVSIVIQ